MTEPTDAPRARASLWRNRDFMLLWSGQTVSVVGSSMSFFVFPVVGLALTGSTTHAALAGAAYSLGSVGMRLPAGALVDRWDRKRVMMATQLVGGLAYASLAGASLLHALTLAHLVLAALLTGVVSCFFEPAEIAALKVIVPAEDLPTAFSQNQARQHVGVLVGPPLGGVLVAVRTWLPFLVDAATYLVSAAALGRVRARLDAPTRRQGADRSVRGAWTDTLEGLRFLLSRGFLRAVLAFATLANFAVNGLFLVLTLKLLRAGVAPGLIGVIDTIGAVAGLVGSVLAPAIIRRVPSGLLAIGGAALITAAVVPMAFTDNVVVIGLLLAVGLLANPAGNACIFSYLAATTPDRLQGRANAALMFSAMALTPLASVVGGWALAAYGGRATMLAAAALTALAAVPLLVSRDVRTLSTPDRWPIAEPSTPAPTPGPTDPDRPAAILEG